MIVEIDMDEKFLQIFCNAGATTGTCSCGKTHVAMLQYDEYDDNDFEMGDTATNMEEMAKLDDSLILHYDSDCCDLLDVGNKVFVAGCECEGWKPYMNFIINQRKEIAEFLIATSKEIKRIQSYEEVIDVLEKEYE